MSVQVVVMSGRPTVISTFAGCGGSSLGYKWAGFEELLAIEWDYNAVETFKLNFPDVPMWKKDMRKVTGKEILEFTGLKQGELDILDGSPPCQGFSIIGKRDISDDRNDLTFEFIRLINELQPKVFVMENVAGMVGGKMKGRFKNIMKGLKSTGYNVRCKLMNSQYYDVAQSRKRLIWIGCRDKSPIFPEPQSEPKCLSDVLPNIVEQNRGQYDKTWKTAQVPCYTITTLRGTGDITAGFTGLIFKTKDGIVRQPTIKEAQLVSSFPEDFIFTGNINEQWKRIGNAVMPKFMEHIAKTIKTEILEKNG